MYIKLDGSFSGRAVREGDGPLWGEPLKGWWGTPLEPPLDAEVGQVKGDRGKERREKKRKVEMKDKKKISRMEGRSKQTRREVRKKRENEIKEKGREREMLEGVGELGLPLKFYVW